MVKFKGIDLRTKGIIVEKTPKISKGKKNIEVYTVEGRNGFLTIDKGTYQSFNVQVECHIKEGTDINEIKAFLDGYGTISFDNDKEYTGIVNNAIPFEKVGIFKRFVIQFLVNPIAKSIATYQKEITTSPETLTIENANTIMNPIIELEANGDISITINNKTFYLYDLDPDKTYTLDSELKEIKDNLNNNASNLMNGEFAELKPNLNQISYTGNITSFVIKYRKSYL